MRFFSASSSLSLSLPPSLINTNDRDSNMWVALAIRNPLAVFKADLLPPAKCCYTAVHPFTIPNEEGANGAMQEFLKGYSPTPLPPPAPHSPPSHLYIPPSPPPPPSPSAPPPPPSPPP